MVAIFATMRAAEEMYARFIFNRKWRKWMPLTCSFRSTDSMRLSGICVGSHLCECVSKFPFATILNANDIFSLLSNMKSGRVVYTYFGFALFFLVEKNWTHSPLRIRNFIYAVHAHTNVPHEHIRMCVRLCVDEKWGAARKLFAKKGNGLNDQIDLTLIANYNFALIYLALVLEQWTYMCDVAAHSGTLWCKCKIRELELEKHQMNGQKIEEEKELWTTALPPHAIFFGSRLVTLIIIYAISWQHNYPFRHIAHFVDFTTTAAVRCTYVVCVCAVL